MQVYNPGLEWRPLRLGDDHVTAMAIEKRMDAILARWRGTPYAAGQAMAGCGVFCTAFVCRVLDELYGKEPTPLPDIPLDVSFHNPDTARSGLRWFLRSYPNHARIVNGEVEPGDVLVTGPVSGGPGHAILVGPSPSSLWEARSGGVGRTGLMIPAEYRLHAVYRLTDRELWWTA